MHMGRGHIILLCILAVSSLLTASLPAKAAPRFEVNIFYPGAAYDTSLINNFENELSVQFTSAKWYQDWGTTFDPAVAQRFSAAGLIPELTWEPQVGGTGVSYDAVVSGTYDAYINETATAIKNLGFPIRVSLAPEMNTDWTPWGIGKQGNNRDNHKLFWRHVVQKFRDIGANNVKWIWSANVRPWNAGALYGSYAEIFPGSDYVDYMGLDGYNWGTSQSWSSWQTFSEVFGSSYSELAGVSGRDILIMEMASTEVGGSKAAWIADLFSQLKNGYSRIAGFTWFHINKETDWRITSSAEAKASFTAGYLGTGSSSNSSNTSSNQTRTSTPAPKSNPTTNEVSTSDQLPAAVEQPAEPAAEPPKKLAGSLVADAVVRGIGRASAENVAVAVAIFFGGGIVMFLFRRRLGHIHLLSAKPGFIRLFIGFGHVDTIHHPRKYRHLHALHRSRLKRYDVTND